MSTDLSDEIINNIFINETNEIDIQAKHTYRAKSEISKIEKDDMTEKLKKQLCSSQQTNIDHLQSLPNFTEQETDLINITKNVYDKKFSRSISEDMHNHKEILNDHNLNNKSINNKKSKEVLQKCNISEDIFYDIPHFIIIKPTPSKGEQNRNAQEILCKDSDYSK